MPEKEEQKEQGQTTGQQAPQEPKVPPGTQAPPDLQVPKEEERKPGEEKGEEQAEDLFDVIVPVGTPRSVLRDVLRKFPVQLVERKIPAYFANMEGDEREILAFRGPRKVVEEVEQFIRKELEAFIETGGWDRHGKQKES
ncbi:MAG: hypothetical protein LUQ41_00920, partial [Methanomicrobiales archaeon]|nr:hypothetical protein [Methanomicrobiales archaeon]